MSNNRRIFGLCVTGVAALGAATALGGCKPADATAAGSAPQTSASVAVATTAAGTARDTAATSATTAAEGGSQGSSTCTGAQLSVRETSPDASAGHRAYVFVFTNKGSSACTVRGYPGAAVAATSGKVVLDAKRTLVGYESGPTTITTASLAPGASASAVVEWTAAPADGAEPTAANCPGFAGGRLLITPPNTTTTTSFALPTDLCGNFEVHPVVSGDTGRPAA